MGIPGSAPCPQSFPPGSGGPSSIVVVQVISVRPNTDLEGDDDYIPFYDNHADIYGRIAIDGETFDLPKIEESDFPHWDTQGARNGVFEKQVASSPVPITIDIWEADSGLTGDDDHVKINEAPGKYQLDFMFDLCALTVTGDINRPAQGLLRSYGGSGDDAAEIIFKVGLKDARPVSQDDLALMDLDLIQVVPHTTRLVGRKPTVVLVRVANNYSIAVDTSLRIRISGGSTVVDETFPLQLGPGEVKKQYLFADHPLFFPPHTTAYNLAVFAEIVDPNAGSLPAGDCRLRNDSISNRDTWKVVNTPANFTVLWAKVGTLLDVLNYVPDSQFEEIIDLGTGYMRAVYPLPGPVSTQMTVDIPPPPLTAATDFLFSILSAFQIPADAFEPIALTFELSGLAALLPCDRLLGVLPNKDWFARFSYWSDVTGFSLGEFAPRAVIFLPRADNGSSIGPMMTLPAHEMGHTFGLSVDSRLKSSWVCSVDWPIVGHAACGLVGGFDEYKNPDPALQDGNPANGYWVRRGSEPAALQPLADMEQCDSACFMGGSPVDAHKSWSTSGRWVDHADYEQLLDKLVTHPDPEVIYVSGMIAWNNQIYLGRCVRLDAGVPDHTRDRGMYGFRFVNRDGRVLREIGLPVAWNHAEFKRPLPVTFFGVTLELPESSARLEIWNRGTGTCLASMDLERSVPEVKLERPEPRGTSSVALRWRAADREHSALHYVVLISPDGTQWWPAAHGLTHSEYVLDTASLPKGDYQVEVLALNSIRVGKSNHVTFRV
jgi:hypothetical protein